MGPGKKSGSQNRKLKKIREESDYKTSLQWKKWLKGDSSSKTIVGNEKNVSESCDSANISENPGSSKSLSSDDHSGISKINEVLLDTSEEEVIDVEANEKSEIIFSDPALWPNINDKVRCCLVERGPEQTILHNFEYPK